MSLVSNNIKYLRKLAGLTQEQFSRRIGIKRSLLGAYEEARANPNHDNLLAMAKSFNVTVDMLLKQDLQRIRQTPELSIPLDGAAPEPLAPAKPATPKIPADDFFTDDPDDPFALAASPPARKSADPKPMPRPAPGPGPRPSKPDQQPIASIVETNYGSTNSRATGSRSADLTERDLIERDQTERSPSRPDTVRPPVVVPPVLAPGARSLVSELPSVPIPPVFPATAPDRSANHGPTPAQISRPVPIAARQPVVDLPPAPMVDNRSRSDNQPTAVAPTRPTPATEPIRNRSEPDQPQRIDPANRYEPVSAQPAASAPTVPESSVHPTIPYIQQFQLAEYRQRHLQPEYLSRLPTMRLPTLPGGHYRAFEADADFVFPGALLIGQFVRNWFEIAEGKLYVMLIQNPQPGESGVFCRRVMKQLQPPGTLLLVADRPAAPTREVALSDVLEVWEVRAFVSQHLPPPPPNLDRIRQLADQLRYEVERIN